MRLEPRLLEPKCVLATGSQLRMNGILSVRTTSLSSYFRSQTEVNSRGKNAVSRLCSIDAIDVHGNSVYRISTFDSIIDSFLPRREAQVEPINMF